MHIYGLCAGALITSHWCELLNMKDSKVRKMRPQAWKININKLCSVKILFLLWSLQYVDVCESGKKKKKKIQACVC